MNNKSVIITGVAGLLGSNLARWILTNRPEFTVYGVDNLEGGLIENVTELERNSDGAFKFEHCDIVATPGMFDLLVEQYRPDYIFHFAAFAAEGLSPFTRGRTYESNLLGTSAVVNACINYGVKKLVYASSMAVYGNGAAPFKEYDLCVPVDPYGIAKYACELDIESAEEQFELKAAILRFHNVYGPGQNIYDPYRNVLGIWMNRMRLNNPLQIYGNGQQVRAFTYVEDLMEPIWNAATSQRNLKLNMCSTHPVSIETAAKLVAEEGKKSGFNVEIKKVEKRAEVYTAWVDGKESEEILGCTYKTKLEEGIGKMWKWVLTMPVKPIQVCNYEIPSKVYSYWKY